MKEIDDTPKDALTDGITDAVRDIAQKREAMAGWEVEYSRKKEARQNFGGITGLCGMHCVRSVPILEKPFRAGLERTRAQRWRVIRRGP